MGWTTELAIVAGRIDLLLDRARSATSIAERRFALDALARGLLLSDPGAVDVTTRAAALALRVDPSTVAAASAPREPHAVAVPLVGRERDLAFVRQVYVAFDPVGLLLDEGFLEARARRATIAAIEQAARHAPPPSDPALHQLVAARSGALAGARIDGPSLGAATYLSAVSLWTGRPIRDGVVVTGAIQGCAVVGVGAMEEKVRAAAAHRAVEIIVPAADEAEARRVAATIVGAPAVVGVADLEALRGAGVSKDAGPRLRPERAVEEVQALFATGWSGYRWPTIAAALSRVSGTLPAERVDLRVDVLSRLGAAQRHLGDPVGSLAILEEAAVIVASEEGRRGVPDEHIAYLHQQISMTHLQLCQFADATREARRGAAVARKARLLGTLIKALGCVGLVALSRGDIDAAIAAFEESLAVARDFDPHRTARTHAYLIEAHGAARDFEAARTHFEAAMGELDVADDDSDRRARESWVRTSWGGALVVLDRAQEAIDAFDAPGVRASIEDEPLPGLLVRRWLGLALLRAGNAEEAFEILAASPLAHGRALAPHLRFLAHLNVLFEAHARTEHGAWGPDIAGRASRALEQLPRYGRVPRFLGKPLADVRGSLDRGRPPPPKAMAALLDRCGRLR